MLILIICIKILFLKYIKKYYLQEIIKNNKFNR